MYFLETCDARRREREEFFSRKISVLQKIHSESLFIISVIIFSFVRPSCRPRRRRSHKQYREFFLARLYFPLFSLFPERRIQSFFPLSHKPTHHEPEGVT